MRRLGILLVVAVAACSKGHSGHIVVATAGPWDQPNGKMHLWGVQLAVEEINRDGGIKGDSLILRGADAAGNDSAKGDKAAAIAQHFVDNDSIVAVIGHVNSGAMVAAAHVYDGHLPAVSSTASSPDLTGISSWVFRVIQSDSVSTEAMAHFANQSLNARRAAVLYENNPFGRGMADAFRRNFIGTIVTFDPISLTGRESFEPYVTFLRAKQPDVVFVGGSEQSGLAFLREARRQGFNAAFMGGVGWTGIIADTVASEGAYVGVPFTPANPAPEAQRFVEAFRQRFGVTPDGKAALAYDAARLVAQAITEVGPDRRAIRDWLQHLNGSRSYSGITSGSMQLAPTGDVINGGFVLTRAHNGTLALTH